MNPTATTTGLVRPSYRSPGQAEYVNVAKYELDLENAEWQAEALRLRLGTVKTELDRAVTQIAARDATIAQLRGELAAEKVKRPGRVKTQIKPVGRLSLHLSLREIRFGERIVPLSRSEADVMTVLFLRPNVLITTQEILNSMPDQPSLNSIRSYIWRVRVKLEAAGAVGYLNARQGWGAGGYWMENPEAKS